MNAKFLIILSTGILLIGVFSASAVSVNGQEKAGYKQILGDWDMEVSAGGEYYYLSFTIEMSGDDLTGTISESTGFFSDVPLNKVNFDGETLTFEMTIPTPPEGYEDLVTAELELVEERLEGWLTVQGLGISATAVATKKDD